MRGVATSAITRLEEPATDSSPAAFLEDSTRGVAATGSAGTRTKRPMRACATLSTSLTCGTTAAGVESARAEWSWSSGATLLNERARWTARCRLDIGDTEGGYESSN